MENQLKATELRIGNLINPDNPIMVEAWMLLPESKINFIGIPLTEDILVKLGFFKSSNNWFRFTFGASKNVKEITTLHYNLTSYTTSLFGDEALEAVYLKEIRYLHQLQNVFFSLTGEELTFKNY